MAAGWRGRRIAAVNGTRANGTACDAGPGKNFGPGLWPRAAALLCGVGVQPFFFFAFFFAAFFFAAISDSF